MGIPFYNGNVKDCYDYLDSEGGLLTAPSGPGLANIPNDSVYYASLLNSDIVIPDSGYMVLIWNFFCSPRIKRLSGLEFINYFLSTFPKEKDNQILLVNPTEDEQEANLQFLGKINIQISEQDCYIAPMYTPGNVVDTNLLKLIELRRPRWVLINIGGGTQEILGKYLKKNLSYRPALICTGAAIAFKTGKQVDIPVWADELYLGWLFRIISSPKKYFLRYWDALSLITLLLKYKHKQVE